ncbi:MAG: RNA polymerase sigma factor [Armatimonadetes bacterium]|nr:RNA polymerase sigma factor [Armatimonadota bacterium]
MPESSRQARFRTVYEANYARILGYVLRRTASPEDAADVVADTFATAWRRFDDLPVRDSRNRKTPDERSIDGPTLWLYGVARRTLANHRRKEANRAAVAEMLARDYEEAVWFDPLPTVGVGTQLAEAWAALRAADRDLLGLVAWEGLTTEQIAAVIGCPRSVSKVRIHRARRRFAAELQRRGVAPHGLDGPVKPTASTRHVQVGRAKALPDTEAM